MTSTLPEKALPECVAILRCDIEQECHSIAARWTHAHPVAPNNTAGRVIRHAGRVGALRFGCARSFGLTGSATTRYHKQYGKRDTHGEPPRTAYMDRLGAQDERLRSVVRISTRFGIASFYKDAAGL